jgi:hypothetical protein
MYPARELNRLAIHKRALQRRIARRREECVAAAGCIARPFAWLDRALGVWRQLSPWMHVAAVPLGFLWKRSPAARPVGAVLRWLPVVTGIMRGFNAARNR